MPLWLGFRLVTIGTTTARVAQVWAQGSNCGKWTGGFSNTAGIKGLGSQWNEQGNWGIKPQPSIKSNTVWTLPTIENPTWTRPVVYVGFHKGAKFSLDTSVHTKGVTAAKLFSYFFLNWIYWLKLMMMMMMIDLITFYSSNIIYNKCSRSKYLFSNNNNNNNVCDF